MRCAHSKKGNLLYEWSNYCFITHSVTLCFTRNFLWKPFSPVWMLARHSNQIYHYWLVDKCQILWIYSFLSAIYCEYILYTIILYLKCMWPVLLIQCEIQFLLLLSFYAVESSSMMQYTLCSNIIYPNFHPSFLQTKITQITPLSVLFNMYNFIHFISFHYQSRLNSNTLCNVTH